MLILIAAFLFFQPNEARAFLFFFASGGAATGDHQKAAEDLIKAFKFEHPEANVELAVSTSYLRPVTETLMQDLGNRAPDVAIVGLVEWPILYRKGFLRRLSTVLSSKELAGIWKSILAESTAQHYGKNVPNKEYALPFNRGIAALYVNTALLPALAGKEVVRWDELTKALDIAAAASTAEDKGKIRLGLPVDDWIIESLLMSALGRSSISGTRSAYADPRIKTFIGQLRATRDSGRLYITPNERQLYDDFISGKTAAVVISTSTYNSVASRATFSYKLLMPPKISSTVTAIGGGDLLLPTSAGKEMDALTKRDIHNFVLWFYNGKGGVIWAKAAAMFPLTRKAMDDPIFTESLLSRTGDARVFRNSAHWSVQSFYELDEYCNIPKVRQAAQKAFEDSMNAVDYGAILDQSDAFLAKLLADRRCP